MPLSITVSGKGWGAGELPGVDLQGSESVLLEGCMVVRTSALRWEKETQPWLSFPDPAPELDVCGQLQEEAN